MIIKKRYEIKQKPSEEKPKVAEIKVQETQIDLFDLDNIDFTQRQERRRGDRRRGYRRIDDRNLVSRAMEEASTIRENAAVEGYKEGLEKSATDVQVLKDNIIEFARAKQEVFEYIAPDILEISVEIARAIIKKEVEQNPECILKSVLDVLKTISKEEPKVTIVVNPTQVNILRENLPYVIQEAGIEIKTNIVGDDTIELGGCILKTSNGIVDATIGTQLEVIKQAFKGS